ncbi:MAG: M15 family metallopeptidase, partial [Gammaproteobacteria bacterium]|nr:M15 family metallopeptidase [Gammaproteobacteria bacterium]
EIDPQTGCTVCEEDQVEMKLSNGFSFKVCRYLAPEIEQILSEAENSGFPLRVTVGYRVGKTRGKIDTRGNRTVFSNHSYGSAIDINPDANGLYDQCISFAQSCRLIKGGHWSPDNPASIKSDSQLVNAFRAKGFRWGGEIQGWQKDFMHFSPTGY